MAEVFIYEKPAVTVKLKSAAAGSEVDVECHAREVALTAEDAETDVSTYCAPGATRPGMTTWTAEILGLQSFGADGLWNQLHPLSKQLCTFTILPDGTTPAGPDNPLATFDAYMPTVPFLTRAAIGEPSEIELTMTTSGEPVFSETPVGGFSSMRVDDLRAEAERQGLDSSGTKAELVERLEGGGAEAAA